MVLQYNYRTGLSPRFNHLLEINSPVSKKSELNYDIENLLDQMILISVDVPGIKEEDLQVEVGSYQLKVEAIRRFDNSPDKHYQQIIKLQSENTLLTSEASAWLENGVLTIRIIEEPRATLKVLHPT